MMRFALFLVLAAGVVAPPTLHAQQQRQPAPAPAAQPAPKPAPAPAARPAPVPQPVPEVFDQWQVACAQDAQGGQACRVQHVVLDQDKRPQLAIVVRPAAAADQLPVATITPPWGISLAQGITLQVDNLPASRIPIRTCLPSGCLADFTLVEALNGQMQKGTALKLTMTAANNQPVTIEAPLAGFAKAYARLLEKTKR